MVNTNAPVVVVLDTTIGENGPTQELQYTDIHENIPLRFQVVLGDGDTVVVEGKLRSSDAFQTLYTFNADTPGPIDLYLPKIWRASRTVDGTSEDSTVLVQNIFNNLMNSHEA